MITPDYDRKRQVPVQMSPRDFVELTTRSGPWARKIDEWDSDILRRRFDPRNGTAPLHKMMVDRDMRVAYWVRTDSAMLQATSFLMSEGEEFQVVYDQASEDPEGNPDFERFAQMLQGAARTACDKSNDIAEWVFTSLAKIASDVGNQSHSGTAERYVILTDYDPQGWYS